MKNFTKLLFLCVILLISQLLKAQNSIAIGAYDCTGAGKVSLSVTPAAGITAYSWKNAGGTFTSTSASITQGSGTYTVTITKITGTSSISIAIPAIVPTTPTVTPATVAGTICGTATQVLTSSTAANYAWLNNGTVITGASNMTLGLTGSSVTTPTTGSYAVRVTNSTSGCTSTSNAVSVTLSPTPTTPAITPVSPNIICGFDTKKLTATAGGNIYTWKRGGVNVTGSTTNDLPVTGTDVSTNGTYNYSVFTTNSAGCTSADSPPVALQLYPTAISLVKPTISPVNGDPITFCDGGSVGLRSSFTLFQNVWSRTTGADIITTGASTIVASSSNTYTVKAQDANGCLSPASNPITVTVNPIPAIPSITPASFSPNLVCGTDTKTLNSTTSSGNISKYYWKRSGILIDSTMTTDFTIDGTRAANAAGGTYAITSYVKTVSGCVSSESSGVVLQLFPIIPDKPTVTANRVTTFCEGFNVKLNSSYSLNTNVWTRSTGDTLTTATDAITVIKSDTYTVKAKDTNGCVSFVSNPIVITVNPRPSLPIIDISSVSICDLDSITLTANNKGNGTYSWNNNRFSRSIVVKTAGNYSLTYAEPVNNCQSLSSAPTFVNVNPLPARPTIENPNAREFCFGQFTTFRASSTTPNAGFEWNYNNSRGNQIDVNGSARLSVAERIIINVKAVSTFANNQLCRSRDASDAVTVTVNPLPNTPTITANGPLTFCPDSTVTLTSSASQNGYIWTVAKDAIFLSDKQSVTFNKSGKYYVQTTSDKSCKSDTSANVTIKIREAPQQASILANPITATVCLGDSVRMTALVANLNIDEKRVIWRDEATKVEVFKGKISYTVGQSGTFSVKVRDGFGCFADFSSPIKVTVNDLPKKPTISIVKPKVFCDEDSVVVLASEATTTPKGNKTTYRWIVDGKTITESYIRQFSWKKASIISVALIDSNGCKAPSVSDTIRTTVNPLPTAPNITIRGSNPFCADKNVTLNAIGASGVTYRWNTGVTTQNITTNVAGNIFAQTVNGFGCISKPSQTILLRVNPLPATPKLTANGEVTFCEGSRVRLVSSSPFNAYWWRSTTDSIGIGDDFSSIFASKTGNYFAKVQDTNGCISLPSATISVDSRANPTPTIIKQIGAFTLDAQGIGDENGYRWRFNGDLQKDFTTRLIKANKDGDYQVQASIAYTGVNLAGGKLICYSNVSTVLKYTQDLSFQGLSIFPNPSPDGVVNVEVADDLIGADIIVYDYYGRLITDYKVDKFNVLKKIELPNLHGTTYIVKIIAPGFERTRKIIINPK